MMWFDPGTILENDYGRYVVIDSDFVAILEDGISQPGTLVTYDYFWHYGKKCYDFNIVHGPVILPGLAGEFEERGTGSYYLDNPGDG